MAFAATALDKVEQGVAVLTVHAIDGVLLAKQRRADFQGGEVQGHEDHALAIQLRLFEMLQAFDVGQPRQALARPPPAHGHFKEGDAGGRKVLLEQLLALFGGFSGKHNCRLRAAMRRRSPATWYMPAPSNRPMVSSVR